MDVTGDLVYHSCVSGMCCASCKASATYRSPLVDVQSKQHSWAWRGLPADRELLGRGRAARRDWSLDWTTIRSVAKHRDERLDLQVNRSSELDTG